MSTELIINASLPETRIALMENGEIQELLIERASGKGIVGNIYKGRVTRVLPGMQAAFVDIGLEKAAFLYVDDVFVHSEIFEEEEGPPVEPLSADVGDEPTGLPIPLNTEGGPKITPRIDTQGEPPAPPSAEELASEEAAAREHLEEEDEEDDEDSGEPHDHHHHEQDDDTDLILVDDEEDDAIADDDGDPEEMGAEGEDDEQPPAGTIAPPAASGGDPEAAENAENSAQGADGEEGSDAEGSTPAARRRFRRGRRGGRNRRKERKPGAAAAPVTGGDANAESPEPLFSEAEGGGGEGDAGRPELATSEGPEKNRPEPIILPRSVDSGEPGAQPSGRRPEFKETRGRDRRIKAKSSARSPRGQANIQDLLQEGQEVLVQVAKDPISTKGARLTCHISLPGRHLVCMPTIDHVGVSRRIERDDERRRLRDFVEKNRPRNLGFIVRTASGKAQSERIIKQDIDYLSRLWTEIKEKSAGVTAPAMVYEDLNSVLRAIRDWVTEEIDKIIVDSRYHYNDIQRFVSHFMPALRHKVELYHGDIPVFDAYGISTELSRALERKVWLKSGGYIVVDQAEALVAIDVNTGRYVGKKNLEDTILKTNLEAVQEIAYQLRLRNCGGIIILDLIDMEKEENRHRVYRALEDALKKDRARPSILKISELGLVEMTRKRTRDTIIRTLCDSCSHCEGKGFIKSKQTVAYEVLREIEREGIERETNKILVQAHPEVIDILAIEERETLDQIERRYRKQIFLQSVADYHPEQFEVVVEKRGGREKSEREEIRGGSSSRGSGNDRNEPGRRDRGRNRTGGRDRGGRNDQNGGREVNPDAPPPIVLPIVASSASGDAPPPAIIPRKIQINPVVIQPAEPGNELQPPPPPKDDFFENEEDRLAFLRAQAAQDAALAGAAAAGNRLSHTQGRNGAGGGGGHAHNNNRGPGAGKDRWGRGPGGGGGNGRGRRGRNNGRGRFQNNRGDRDQGNGRGISVGPADPVTANEGPVIPPGNSDPGDHNLP